MKLFLLTDLEGVAGVMNAKDWIYQTSIYYETAKKLLTEEVNAAVAGFRAGGFEDIVVADTHGYGAINVELLDENVRLLKGWATDPGPYPFGVCKSFDAMAIVGLHAKAGTGNSHITHTLFWHFLDITVNGISVGEYGLCSLTAGEFDVPMIFTSGEKALCREAKKLTPWVITAAVKEGTIKAAGNELTAEKYENFHDGAIHLHPQKARQLIRKQAEKAANAFADDKKAFKPLKLRPPYHLVCKLRPYKHQPAATIEIENPKSLIDLFNELTKKVPMLYEREKPKDILIG